MNERYYYSMPDAGETEHIRYIPTFPEFLNFLEKEYENDPAVSDKVHTFTYGGLLSRVRRRIGFLYQKGLPAGANVAVVAGNNLDTMELFLAIPAAGLTVVMLPKSLPITALISLVKKFDVRFIFSPDDGGLSSENAGVPVVPIDETSDTEADYADVQKETPAAIFLTGGTTGVTKGAVLSHGALLRGAYNGVFSPGKILRQTYLLMLPMTHVFGAIRSYLTALFTGSFIYACPDMKAAIRDIAVLKPTMLVLVPGLMEIILNMAKLRGKAMLGDLKLMITGAAPVTPKILKLCSEFGITVCPGYGLTECANLTSGNNDTDVLPGAVGPIYPEQEAKIVDGELWLRGDNVMLEYYGEPEMTEAAFSDGWFKTGDLAEFREYQGTRFLFITGRIKNLIILPNGENVSPEALEALFYAHREVKDCLVREMAVSGTPVIGVEILPALSGLTEAELNDRYQTLTDEINQSLPSWQKIRKVIVRTQDFKRSAAMKILRNQEA